MLPLTFQTDRLPPTTNARNWPGVVLMRRGIRNPGAVWAQEAYEAGWKLWPWNLMRRLFSREAQRRLETRGHEIEVQAAVMLHGADPDSYRAREALDMAAGYPAFEGVPAAMVFDQMRAQDEWAARWVSRRAAKIRRMARRLGER